MKIKHYPINQFKKGYTPWNKGKHLSLEHRQKLSESRKGQKAWNKGLHPEYMLGQNHHAWKGDKAGYRAIHIYIENRLGKANKCSFNFLHKSARYHWANISKSYLRDLNDWVSLCPKCHKQYDTLLGGKVYA